MAKKQKGKMKGSSWAKMLGVAAAMRMISARRVLIGLAVVAGGLYAWRKLTDED